MQSSLRTKKGFLKATARLQAAYALHGGQDQEGQVSVWPSNMTVGTKQAIEVPPHLVHRVWGRRSG